MIITKEWAMPSAKTFAIKPINDLITAYIATANGDIVDPFAGSSPFLLYYTVSNDLDPAKLTDHHMDALDFLTTLETGSVGLMLFDPPYSPRQVSECYKKLGKTVNMQTTQSSYWGNLKKEIARVVRQNGMVVTCGWNSGGIGKTLGFKQKEILLVAHGGWHNDTIVTVEKKTTKRGEK